MTLWCRRTLQILWESLMSAYVLNTCIYNSQQFCNFSSLALIGKEVKVCFSSVFHSATVLSPVLVFCRVTQIASQSTSVTLFRRSVMYEFDKRPAHTPVYARANVLKYILFHRITDQQNQLPYLDIRVSDNASLASPESLESHSKISHLTITVLFYSHILHMNTGSLHTRSFRRIHFSIFRY